MDTTDTSVRDVARHLTDKGYRQIKYLAKGGFGYVLSATLLNEAVAIKIVKNEKRWELEERIWPLLRNKNILPLLEMIEVKHLDLTLFVMPKHPCDLNKVLSSESFLGDKNGLLKLKHWLFDILNGLNYLHTCGYAHLDLKKNNVLISEDETALLCDFSTINLINVPLDRLCCPKKFRPPECYDVGEYKNIEGSKFDVWLFGIMTLNILTKNWPSSKMGLVKCVKDWKENVEPMLKEVLKERSFCYLISKAFPAVCIPDGELLLAQDFVSYIMQWDKSKRPPVNKIIGHPFLRNLESGDSLNIVNTVPGEVKSVLISPLKAGVLETKTSFELSSMEVPKTTSNKKLAISYNVRHQHSESKDSAHGKYDILPESNKLDENMEDEKWDVKDHRFQCFDNKGFLLKNDDVSPELEKSKNIFDSNFQKFDAWESYTIENVLTKDKKKRSKRVKEWIARKWNGIFNKKMKYSDPKHYSFYLIFCWPPNCPADQTAIDKYEVEHILHKPEVPEKSDKYIFKYSTKCLKLKVSDQQWPSSVHIKMRFTHIYRGTKEVLKFNNCY